SASWIASTLNVFDVENLRAQKSLWIRKSFFTRLVLFIRCRPTCTNGCSRTHHNNPDRSTLKGTHAQLARYSNTSRSRGFTSGNYPRHQPELRIRAVVYARISRAQGLRIRLPFGSPKQPHGRHAFEFA